MELALGRPEARDQCEVSGGAAHGRRRGPFAGRSASGALFLVDDHRGHAIFALNLLGGWTALRWLAAFVWSLNSNTRANIRCLASGELSKPPDDRALKPDRGGAPVVCTFIHSNVRDGDRLDRDIHYQAFVVDEWRKASPEIPGGISATIDGQPCKIASFTPREHGDGFYATLLLGGERKTFTIANHQWKVGAEPLAPAEIAEAWVKAAPLARFRSTGGGIQVSREAPRQPTTSGFFAEAGRLGANYALTSSPAPSVDISWGALATASCWIAADDWEGAVFSQRPLQQMTTRIHFERRSRPGSFNRLHSQELANDNIAFGASASQISDIALTSDELMKGVRTNFVAEDGIVVRAMRTATARRNTRSRHGGYLNTRDTLHSF